MPCVMQNQGQTRIGEEQFKSVVIATATQMKFTPTVITNGAVVLTRQKHPTWTIVLAIILFPIGLLFLLKKEDQTASVQYTVGPGGVGYSVTGEAGKLPQAIASALQPYAIGGGSSPLQLPGDPPRRPD